MGLTGPQRAGIAAALVAGAGLGTALASEHWGGLVPCALCLLERWPYRITILLGVVAAAVPAVARPLLGLAALTMLASVGLAGTHVGVELGWWPSPLPECAAPVLGGGTMAERLARMPDRPAKPCDEPTYLVPGLPVSMAAMNLVLSLALTAGLAAVALRRSPPPSVRSHA
jgi:disulfide bond formation protein DsbB